jgi:lactoylglutathione lyase
MNRVLDEERSVRDYRQAFALGIADRFDLEAFTLVSLRNAEADFERELTVNKGRTEHYDLGDGYGHSAFVVDDGDAHPRLTAAGLSRASWWISLPADPDGHQIEVLKRGGRYR